MGDLKKNEQTPSAFLQRFCYWKCWYKSEKERGKDRSQLQGKNCGGLYKNTCQSLISWLLM